MIRNILALQQNLKSMIDTSERVSFEKSRKIWDYLLQTPEEVLQAASKDGGAYNFEEYKAVLHLILGLDNLRNPTAATGTLPTAIPSAGTLLASKDVPKTQYNEYRESMKAA